MLKVGDHQSEILHIIRPPYPTLKLITKVKEAFGSHCCCAYE